MLTYEAGTEPGVRDKGEGGGNTVSMYSHASMPKDVGGHIGDLRNRQH